MTGSRRARGWLWPAGLLCCACSMFRAAPPPPPYVPIASWRSPRLLLDPPRSVLVLPFSVDRARSSESEPVRDAVLLVLRELHPFEVHSLTREELVRLSVPIQPVLGVELMDALIRLRQDRGADAVLFGSVTYHRPYGDPALGLRLTLIDTEDAEVLWQADSVVDTLDPSVRGSLSSYHRQAGEPHAEVPPPDQTPFASFARFVASSYAVALLPSADPASQAGEETP